MRKNGISLVELIVASAILTVMMAVSLQLLGLVASGRKAVRQRQTAVREAGGVHGKLWKLLTFRGRPQPR